MDAAIETAYQEAVRDALHHESVCVPAGMVLLSYVNDGHAQLRHLQLSRVMHLDCLLARMVTLGANYSDGMGAIVRAQASRLSNFRDADFYDITWLKWRLIGLATAVPQCRAAFWLDADVVLLRNPFEGISRVGHCAVQYQAKQWGALWTLRPPAGLPTLGPGLNSGQMLISDHAFASRVLAKRSNAAYIRFNASWEQDVAQAVLVRNSSCPLPGTFASECALRLRLWNDSALTAAASRITSELCRLTTYHACCVTHIWDLPPNGSGGVELGKAAIMRRALMLTSACTSSSRLAQVAWDKNLRSRVGLPKTLVK